jgi:hypothetical protein
VIAGLRFPLSLGLNIFTSEPDTGCICVLRARPVSHQADTGIISVNQVLKLAHLRNSRYDPAGLIHYLEGRENWLLTEFIELGPMQFIDELVCEMTSLEFGSPGIRPRST